MAVRAHHRISLGEYFDIEKMSPLRHEYFEGRILAMAGPSYRHNLVVANVNGVLHSALRGTACAPLGGDMRLRTPAGLWTYADVTVMCGRPQFTEDNLETATNPTVLVEVLSPSTRDYDLGEKREMYLAFPTLTDLVFFEQDSVNALHDACTPEGWRRVVHASLDDVVRLVGVDAALPLRDVYERVFD